MKKFNLPSGFIERATYTGAMTAPKGVKKDDFNVSVLLIWNTFIKTARKSELSDRIFSNKEDREDILAEGNLGLAKAIETFDPEKGIKFDTYASKVILNAMRNAYIKIAQTKYHFVENKRLSDTEGSETTLVELFSDKASFDTYQRTSEDEPELHNIVDVLNTISSTEHWPQMTKLGLCWLIDHYVNGLNLIEFAKARQLDLATAKSAQQKADKVKSLIRDNPRFETVLKNGLTVKELYPEFDF